MNSICELVMVKKNLGFEIVYSGETRDRIDPRKCAFFQRLKEHGGGFWLGQAYDDWFGFVIEEQMSLRQGMMFDDSQDDFFKCKNVIQYQDECDDVLYDYWTKRQVTNPRKMNRSTPGKITIEQQEAVKQLVMTRGKALPKEKQAKAMITMWSALKTHFGVTYKEIDGAQFTEALSLAARIPLEGEFIGKEGAPIAEETYTMTISRSELCSLCWVWNAAEHMREVLVATHPALELLRSSLANTFDTMGSEYRRTLNDGKEILLRETRNIEAHPYAIQDAAWRSVLPRLRNIN